MYVRHILVKNIQFYLCTVRYAKYNSYHLIATAKLHECSILENEEHSCSLSQIISFYLVQLKFVSSYSSQFSYYPRFLLFIFFQHFPFHFKSNFISEGRISTNLLRQSRVFHVCFCVVCKVKF